MKVIDLTITYKNGMTGMSKWHPVVDMHRLGKIEEIGLNTSSILLGSHIGTHMDAQSHFIEDGYTIDETPMEKCIGDVTVVDVRHRGKGDRLMVEDLQKYDLKERVLLVFGWDDKYFNTDGYIDGFPYFSMEAAKYMQDKGVKLIAMDIPSPDTNKPLSPETKHEVHKFMLKEKTIFVEALINTKLINFDEDYELIALPLKLEGLDASPCRVLLVEK